MKKQILYKIILVIIIIILCIFISLVTCSIYTRQSLLELITDDVNVIENNKWEKISFKNDKNTLNEIKNIDLNNDGKTETIIFSCVNNANNKEHYISINGKILSIIEEERFNKLEDYFYIKDINRDGILELIFEGKNIMISPRKNSYYIFNYINDNFKQIATFSIVGDLKAEFEVNGNEIRQEYEPYESREGYKTVKQIKLNMD